MIIKLYNENSYIFINKNKYVNSKNYYEEILKLKFNKTQLNNNIVDEINLKIQKYIKNKV
jgi:hypothetical protein